jgi:teichuronic acid biosynthesis glycosyltransferase TuaC
MKILTYTSLYPDSTRPAHGIFVETRLRHLLALGGIEARVVAPVPWFPSDHPRFGTYARYAAVPRREMWHGIDVTHPRYPLLPKIGMSTAPFSMAAFTCPVLRRLIREGYDFDVIDAHYFYPDGVAAMLLGKALGKPVVITARGTDLNLIPGYRIPRRLIRWAARDAAGLVTVCRALKEVLVQLGIPEERVIVVRNGVDLDLFKPPAKRDELREKLGIRQPTLLSVGHLVVRKGHDLVIQALCDLPGVQLLVIGNGPERARLVKLAEDLGLSARVRFLGAMDQSRLVQYYQAADALVLASSREGWANVLLESLACGTPVVATRIWGTPEVIASPDAGVLADGRTPGCLSMAISKLFSEYPDRRHVRRYAERFDWWSSVQRLQEEVFKRIVAS